MTILSAMQWFPDSWMVRVQYYLQTGKKLRLKNPVTFNEKLQAYKLYYRNPEMLRCTDKVTVRDYVKEQGLENILVPLIGIYNGWEEINTAELPEEFVVKSSDGGGGNEVIFCRKKSAETLSEIKEKVKRWISSPKPKKHIAREWAYDNHHPRKIIIETLLKQKNGAKDIDDFKFYCSYGKFRFLQWHKDRSTPQHKAAHFDENLNFLPEVTVYYPTFEKPEPFPANIREMIEVAEKLSRQFPFVRVDLYNVEGKIYFGEMTFYPASGYFQYDPPYVNEMLGSFIPYPFEP